MPEEGSLLIALERAKRLFVQDCFETAIGQFDSCQRQSLHSAPDIWLDAVYGSAECMRTRHQFAKAAEAYLKVLRRMIDRSRLQGRLAESNRISVIFSFRGLVWMGRLTLRFEHSTLVAMVHAGKQWIAQTGHTTEVLSRAFEAEEARLIRVQHNPAAAREAVRAPMCAPRHEPVRGDQLSVVARLLDQECLLCQGLPVQVKEVPLNNPAGAWAWIFARLLRTESFLRACNWRAARRELTRIADLRPRISLWPELETRWVGLRLELSIRRERPSSTDNEDLAQLSERLQQGLRELADASSPLWCSLRILRLAIERSSPPPGDLSQAVATALENWWLRRTLVSRGIAEEELVRMRRAKAGRRDLGDLIRRLEEAVRP